MKFNWKIFLVVAVMVVVSLWAFDTIRTHSYSGTELDFNVGSGVITITNPSDELLPVSLVSTTPGTFRISSDTLDVPGRSQAQGIGRDATQLFEFELPPGTSEFTIVNGSDINFVSNTDVPLEATVQPLSAQEARLRVIVAVAVILVSLFYLSHLNGHLWFSPARRKRAAEKAEAQQNERDDFKRIFGKTTSDK